MQQSAYVGALARAQPKDTWGGGQFTAMQRTLRTGQLHLLDHAGELTIIHGVQHGT